MSYSSPMRALLLAALLVAACARAVTLPAVYEMDMLSVDGLDTYRYNVRADGGALRAAPGSARG